MSRPIKPNRRALAGVVRLTAVGGASALLCLGAALVAPAATAAPSMSVVNAAAPIATFSRPDPCRPDGYGCHNAKPTPDTKSKSDKKSNSDKKSGSDQKQKGDSEGDRKSKGDPDKSGSDGSSWPPAERRNP